MDISIPKEDENNLDELILLTHEIQTLLNIFEWTVLDQNKRNNTILSNPSVKTTMLTYCCLHSPERPRQYNLLISHTRGRCLFN